MKRFHIITSRFVQGILIILDMFIDFYIIIFHVLVLLMHSILLHHPRSSSARHKYLNFTVLSVPGKPTFMVKYIKNVYATVDRHILSYHGPTGIIQFMQQ